MRLRQVQGLGPKGRSGTRKPSVRTPVMTDRMHTEGDRGGLNQVAKTTLDAGILSTDPAPRSPQEMVRVEAIFTRMEVVLVLLTSSNHRGNPIASPQKEIPKEKTTMRY